MGRHAAADEVDDEALASEPFRPGAHRADAETELGDAAPAPSTAKGPARRSHTKDVT
jgi:hypothetical protein